MTNLPSLIEKVEAASGPDRELDAAIHTAATTFEPCVGGVGWPDGALVVPVFPGWKLLPSYTESLDAAMSLCPSGANFVVCREAGVVSASVPLAGVRNSPVVFAATPALALTAAALRSLANEGG